MDLQDKNTGRDLNEYQAEKSTYNDPMSASSPTEESSFSEDEKAQYPGVIRMEVITSQLTRLERIWLLSSIFLICYAYGLDAQVRSTYQSYATSDFGEHSLLATVNVLNAVIAAAAQPTAARIADVFGRFELIVVSIVFYIIGTIVESCATSISSLSAGAVLYQVGYSGIVMLITIIIADVTSMRSRVLFSYIPVIPYIINTWISGNLTSSVLATTTWRWGIGMWCIILFVCSLPLLVVLFYISRRASKSGAYKDHPKSLKALGLRKFSINVFHRLDVIGLILMIALFGLILALLTIAGGTSSEWRSAHIIAPLVIGFCCIPVFIIWEMKGARHPLAPFHLLKDRSVWATLAIRCLLNFSWYLQGDYLYTVLIVSFDFSIATATRIYSFYDFFGCISGVIVGVAIFKTRRLKYFIVAGACFFMVSFGVILHFRGGSSNSSKAGAIAGQVLIGLAGGFCAYPSQAAVQAATKHEHMAVITGIYLASFNLGTALGTCVSGVIWTQTLYKQLLLNLADTKLATEVYASPFEVVPSYPIGTSERTAIIDSYRHVQRTLCITGICLVAPIILVSLALRNPKLSKEQTQPDAEAQVAVERVNK